MRPEYSTASVAAALRRRLWHHNLQVFGYASFSLVTALFLWVALYGVSYWFSLLTITVSEGVRGGEAHPPDAFHAWFGVAVFAILTLGLLDRLARRPNAQPRDKTTPLVFALDLILALPRITFGVADNLRAWVSLETRDLRQAAVLVEHVLRHRGLPLTAVPLEIPLDATRDRIVTALLLIEALSIRTETPNVPWLRPGLAGFERAARLPVPATPPSPITQAPGATPLGQPNQATPSGPFLVE